jgi:NO-binding membrane sensor protein with MHYT domain
MDIRLVGLDLRLVALSGLILILATYSTIALASRIKYAQGAAWFGWLGGGASGMGIGIWFMHYIGLKILGIAAPTLKDPAVPLSILATIFASAVTLLVASGRGDSGRLAKDQGQRLPLIGIDAELR